MAPETTAPQTNGGEIMGWPILKIDYPTDPDRNAYQRWTAIATTSNTVPGIQYSSICSSISSMQASIMALSEIAVRSACVRDWPFPV